MALSLLFLRSQLFSCFSCTSCASVIICFVSFVIAFVVSSLRNCFFFRKYHYMTKWILALALGIYKLVVLKCRVDDPSLVRIHRLKRCRTSCSLYLVGNILCQLLESLLSSFTVILSIQLDTNIFFAVFVYNKAHQMLQ